MSNQTLSDQWPYVGDSVLESFLSLLNIQDVEDAGLEERLQKIEKHRLFKVMEGNKDFEDAYKWIGSERIGKNKNKWMEDSKKLNNAPPTRIKIKFLESVTVAVTQIICGYSTGFSAHTKHKDMEEIQKQAQKLIEKIKAKGFADSAFPPDCEYARVINPESAFSISCQHTAVLLKYISTYPLKKIPKMGKTYHMRDFVYELVVSFMRNKLPTSETLFRKILRMVKTRNSESGKRNLIAIIRASEDYCKKETENLSKWEKVVQV